MIRGTDDTTSGMVEVAAIWTMLGLGRRDLAALLRTIDGAGAAYPTPR